MYPFISIGNWHIQSFNVMVAIGILLAVLFIASKFEKNNISPEHAFHLGTIAIISGFLGCRLLYTLEFHQNYGWQIFNIFDFHWYFLGAILATVIFVLCLKNIKNIILIVMLVLISFILRSFAIYIYPIAISILLWQFIRILYLKKALTSHIPTKNKKVIVYGFVILSYIVTLLITLRIIHVYIHYEYYNWSVFHFYKGGMTIYGGLLCGFLFCSVYIKKQSLSFLKVCDILIISVFLAMIPGRLGCFANGCCFGKDAPNSSISMHFPVVSPVGQSQLKGLNTILLWNTYAPEAQSYSEFLFILSENIPPTLKKHMFPPVYPTQLISSLYNFIIFFLLLLLYRKKRYNGQVFLTGICLYSLCRFLVEILRHDNPMIGDTGLTAAQNISVVLFTISFTILLFIRACRHSDLFNF